ncbi:MAG: hypothetical protein ABI318_06970 [Chthoniobacteraceae bacterium]
MTVRPARRRKDCVRDRRRAEISLRRRMVLVMASDLLPAGRATGKLARAPLPRAMANGVVSSRLRQTAPSATVPNRPAMARCRRHFLRATVSVRLPVGRATANAAPKHAVPAMANSPAMRIARATESVRAMPNVPVTANHAVKLTGLAMVKGRAMPRVLTVHLATNVPSTV